MNSNDRWSDDGPDDDPEAQALRDFLDHIEPQDWLPQVRLLVAQVSVAAWDRVAARCC